VVKDQEQMKQKREEEKKKKKKKTKKKPLGKKRRGKRLFLPSRSIRKKKNLKTNLKRYFFLNNHQASCFVKEHIKTFLKSLMKENSWTILELIKL